MTTYRFLIAWMSGADAIFGEDNGINSIEDMFDDSNEHVTRYEFELPDGAEDFAADIGRGMAFIDEFTALDSLSTVQVRTANGWEEFVAGLHQPACPARLATVTAQDADVHFDDDPTL